MARRHSALPDSAAALKLAGSAESVAGSWGGSSQPKRTLTNGSSEAREASPGSDSLARAALGLGATMALAPRQPRATSECEAESSPSNRGPRSCASAAESGAPVCPVGSTNSRTGAELATSAAAVDSPQPMATSGEISLSAPNERTAPASSAVASARSGASAPSTRSWASLRTARPS
jgi:hypothetical protein